MFPKVVQVIPMKNYSEYVYFEDGKIVCYDMSRMIDKEAFSVLKDINIFYSLLNTISPISVKELGNEIDLMYEQFSNAPY